MNNFNDDEYTVLISNLLNDTQYVQVSNMGKIGGLRKHAEVMVRKILNIGSSYKLTLGEVRYNSTNIAVNKGLNILGDDLSDYLINRIKIINPLARQGNHTQRTTEFSNEEVEKVEDAILDLYALLFIRYFLEYQKDKYFSNDILHIFSFLPPIIRYKTWNYLLDKHENKLQILDKLVLSIIKAYSKSDAYEWIDRNKKYINSVSYPNKEQIEEYITTVGKEIYPGEYIVSIDFDAYNNMYDLLYDKIKADETGINEGGKMYHNFEEALKHYNLYKEDYINTSSAEEEIFQSLMEFVYLGRKSIEELE
ncbi:Uncharacterised protein [[Clostridium] sordellii]|uniref:hypothetical protein n=1 Tax=Paraclostridium sordellii TaxID=1505 RepID=UPI0005E8517C|nr:hypothetical protein [Paeniclostridium sordellii]CEQ09815.1 Uncharacterised protein [[Clostridium] sordellii] [Paeniclostridium sordellii]